MAILSRGWCLSEELHGHFEPPLSQFGLPRGGGRPGDQGGTAGSTRAQSGRSVEVERPFRPVDGVSLKSFMVTLSDLYRSLASQGGDDQGGIAGPFPTKVVVLLRWNDHSATWMVSL